MEDGRSEYRLITRMLLRLVEDLGLGPVGRRRGDEADPEGTAGATVVCRRRIIGGADDRGRRRGGRCCGCGCGCGALLSAVDEVV